MCSGETTIASATPTQTAMNIVPPSNRRSALAAGDATAASAAPALPDVLREQRAARPLAAELADRHPLESRLRDWDACAQRTRLEQYRRIFGAAEPVRRTMELALVSDAEFAPLGAAALHLDVLNNTEASLDWHDVYPDEQQPDVHAAIERSLRL
ncbi:AGR208Wp [Eremothecium gossypii ATCC 10895]|uniref:AGR208Wp n=1 Tax=Eremothecium gossypii (strain ATCC 10895 / CBS 109.51 / FGSC 9923 / NRRL Y-1056) TaxID=284811 RepID=Q74ZJ4_EREGS|nr:AGR208Wp [Eremothecium gossypii ATCC 10895]AAS54698.1 AGR208Wp [Eremothecium gossypii ATCC 10895]AEY99028.1 FAGR208Wp [Eremothecium gossypii FDAG1]